MSNWIWYDLTNQLHCVDFGKHLKPKGVKCVGNSTSTYKNIDLDLVVQETVIFWSGLCSTLTNDAEVLPLSCIWLTTNSNFNLSSIHRLPMSVSLWLKKPDQLDFPSSLTQVHIMPIFFRLGWSGLVCTWLILKAKYNLTSFLHLFKSMLWPYLVDLEVSALD